MSSQVFVLLIDPEKVNRSELVGPFGSDDLANTFLEEREALMAEGDNWIPRETWVISESTCNKSPREHLEELRWFIDEILDEKEGTT